jgi:endoglucanase
VRRATDHSVAYSAPCSQWNGGATHAQSGDKAWWFDFSPVTEWGEYYIYDPENDASSPRFRMDTRVYARALRDAVRVFFYQRRGHAKQPPYVPEKWADAASHLHPGQDTECRLVTDPSNISLQRDLHGGWFDAGDYNKYVNFAYSPLSDLLFAYRRNPEIWTDDFGIPESNNGVPDLLDEIKWELDWLLRMQNPDGSVLSKVAVTGFENASPPSADATPIYYGAASTSATLTAAAVFANASAVFKQAGLEAYADTLENAAVNAWNWAKANPAVIYTNSGFASANPEVTDYDRIMLRLCASVFLYEITGDAEYKNWFESNYATAHAIEWWYWYAFEAPYQDALIHYTTLPGINTTVRNTILSRKQTSIEGSEFLQAWTAGTDTYRAYVKDEDMVWGSNRVKSHIGILFANQLTYNLDSARATDYRNAAAAYLHYMHGINPLGLVYLTNMGAAGAENSVNQIYHAWFTDGSIWDHAQLSQAGPPPGYVPGGPNRNFAPHPSYSGPPLEPPLNQPAQKAYRDWNSNDWREESWEVTEPSLSYQAAYVHLLSHFVRPLRYDEWAAGHSLPDSAPSADPDGDGHSNLEEFALGTDPRSLLSKPLLSIQLSGGEVQLSFTRAQGASDLTLELEISGLLNDWQAAGIISPGGTAPEFSESGEGETRVMRLALPDADRKFGRIRIQLE